MNSRWLTLRLGFGLNWVDSRQVPQTLDETFDTARTRTFLPHHTDLTPPSTSSTSVRSRSTSKNMLAVSQTLQRFSVGDVGVGQVREVLVEWAWGLEQKLSEGEGEGSGSSSSDNKGKGAIGSAGFQEIAASFDQLVSAHLPPPVPPSLSAVLLSVRMSLGYLTLSELSCQLSTLLALREGEECLRIWVERRIQGDGRYRIGETLDSLVKETERTRPALRGVVRMVKDKFMLPVEEEATRWKVPLPVPGKGKVILLLKEQAQLQSQAASSSSSTALSGYAFEMLSEYIVKEKRDYMRLEKWTKSGKKQLSRDVDEIEDKLCLPGNGNGKASGSASVENTSLLPVFDVLRRIHALDPAASKVSSTREGTSFQPMAIPEWTEPYLPPTVQTITSALYVHPRLSTARAVDCVMELVNYEKDLRTMDVRGAMSREEEAGRGDGEGGRSSEDTVLTALVWGPLEKSKMRRVLETIERRVRLQIRWYLQTCDVLMACC